eukprot:TRINITY_DN9518_c1_g2_i1.p1 TRINITY_DN9518_c1_g2~~TRINITY_DN9518_c1_g2_i1.p1  ORF type:complete len:466 (-),score=61.12 TRINITY_DN9518_c1_g2_i1:125-1522(-)
MTAEAESGIKPSKSVFYESWTLLADNPDVAKVGLAAGLLVSVCIVSPVYTLVIVELKTEIWSDRMSEYGAHVGTATNIMAILFTGPFGRLSDRIDRRLALALVGVICFLPTWLLLPLMATGQRSAALYVNTISAILGGLTGLTSTGCPTIFALVDDIVPPENRDLFFGVAFALAILVTFMVNIVGLLVVTMLGQGPTCVVIFATGLTIVFFLAIASVRLPTDAWQRVQQRSQDRDDGMVSDLLEPMRLASGYAPVRNLCIVFFLVSFSETATLDVNNQYVLTALGMMNSDEGQVRSVSALLNYPGQFLLCVFFIIVGIVSKAIGTQRLVLSLIPLLSFILVLPVLFAIMPSLPAVPLEGVCLIFSFVIFAPLQSLASEVAPFGRVGETMGAIGASKQFSALFGNMIVGVMIPALLKSGLPQPLFVMFPLCGVLFLASWPFALHIEVPEKGAYALTEMEGSLAPSS